MIALETLNTKSFSQCNSFLVKYENCILTVVKKLHFQIPNNVTCVLVQ